MQICDRRLAAVSEAMLTNFKAAPAAVQRGVGWQTEWRPASVSANGYYHSYSKQFAINNALSALQLGRPFVTAGKGNWQAQHCPQSALHANPSIVHLAFAVEHCGPTGDKLANLKFANSLW